MMFLQSALLWGLLAVAIPILIHLLNKLRFRSVSWGAMMFLQRISRSATRRSRWRHYALLACRALAMAALALALARPLVGGLFGGWMPGGAPDAVIILLDRSSSMQDWYQGHPPSKQERALADLAAISPERLEGRRLILLESVLMEPREVAATTHLRDMSWTQPSDTAVYWPAMFERALDWMDRHQPGRTEWWIISDMQASGWRHHSTAWDRVHERLSTWRPAPLMRLLPYTGSPPDARQLAIQALGTERRSDGSQMLKYRLITRPFEQMHDVPVTLLYSGGQRPHSLSILADVTQGELEWPSEGETGWLGIALPADATPGDNSAWFVYGTTPTGSLWLRAENETVRSRVQQAFRPSRANDAHPVRLWPDGEAAPSLEGAALVVWQGHAPSASEQHVLQSFLHEGGVVLLLPPADETPPPASAGEPSWFWHPTETAPSEQPWRFARWDEMDGPFAHAQDGSPLPLGEAPVFRRARFHAEATRDFYQIAAFADQTDALRRYPMGAGRLYSLSTLPLPDWSGLDDGRIWIPLLWRLRAEGAGRLGEARMAVAGEWDPGNNEILTWTPVAPEEAQQPRWHAGIFNRGSQWTALNRPVEEDDRSVITTEALLALLPNARWDVTSESALERGATATEVSFPLLVLAGLFFLGEGFLSLSLYVRKKDH